LNDTDDIRIADAYENNLKHVSLTIPKRRLVVFTGVSGSGKSSLAFDTIAVESSRQWQANYPLFLRNKMPHYERPKVESIENLTPSIVVDQHSAGTSARSTVGTAIDAAPLVRLLFSRCGKPSAGGSMAYSFNHPMGMCPDCSGLGERWRLVEDRLFDLGKTLREGAIRFSQFSAGWQTYLYQANPLIDADKPLRDFSEAEWRYLKYGGEGKPVKVEIRSNNTGRVDKVDYEGVLPRFERLYLKRDITKLKKSLQDEIMSLVEKAPCPTCGGAGLNSKALASRINGRNIVDYGEMTARELAAELRGVTDAMGVSLARQISAYLERMDEVGIGYLSLSRKTDTLSGGELQRIKMVRSLASSLTNITYIFDEPTAGLHPADAEKIGRLLTGLRDRHNSVFVVEHNRQMIELADHIAEMGPNAGTAGGEIVFQGSLAELKAAGTPTGRALAETISVNPSPRKWSDAFEVRNATAHNLKNVSVRIPKGVLTAVTGVAGSGKSSLVCHEFVRQHPGAIVISQKAIGTSIRSNPATYTGVMDEIRKAFAAANGVAPSLFSFNSKGACEACGGTGRIVYDMAFAEPVEVICEQCGGHRYSKVALGYAYRGRNIEDALNLTVNEALDFFEGDRILRPLKSLVDVGLGYLSLGQPTSTMSGGEIQRLKLASELGRTGQVYVMDEPSTGLHNKDLAALLALFRRLVDNGNTVVIVEHRLELIAQADWIIDMGPGGGSDGGEVVFTGTPCDLLSCPTSKTAHWLAHFSMIAQASSNSR